MKRREQALPKTLRNRHNYSVFSRLCPLNSRSEQYKPTELLACASCDQISRVTDSHAWTSIEAVHDAGTKSIRQSSSSIRSVVRFLLLYSRVFSWLLLI
jgi:hypothetical protein